MILQFSLEQLFIIFLLLLSIVLLCAVLIRQSKNNHSARMQLSDTTDYIEQLGNALLNNLEQSSISYTNALQTETKHLYDAVQAQQASINSLLSSQTNVLNQGMQNTNDALGRLDNRIDHLRTSVTGSLDTMRADNNNQLNEMRKTVDEKLSETLEKRLTSSFELVRQQLDEVHKGLGEMQSLAQGVGDLKKVLTNVKTRGSWGEVQLGALLEQVLTKEQYAENIAVIPGSSERVEYALILPGKQRSTVYLPIDCKFPQENYLRLIDASRDGLKEQAEAERKELVRRIKTEAKSIAGKYLRPPYTTDFAIMYLPVEGLYAEIVQSPSLTEELQQQYHVVVAGPSTFAALLNALQMGFRTLAIEQRSADVWRLLAAVKGDLSKFETLLETTRQRLRQASESVENAFKTTHTMSDELRHVESPMLSSAEEKE